MKIYKIVYVKIPKYSQTYSPWFRFQFRGCSVVATVAVQLCTARGWENRSQDCWLGCLSVFFGLLCSALDSVTECVFRWWRLGLSGAAKSTSGSESRAGISSNPILLLVSQAACQTEHSGNNMYKALQYLLECIVLFTLLKESCVPQKSNQRELLKAVRDQIRKNKVTPIYLNHRAKYM